MFARSPDIRGLPVLLALVPLATAVACGPALAQAPTMRAELSTPLDGDREVIVDGRLWNCTGNACTAGGADPRPAVACRKLARKVGPVARFETSHGALDPAALASCNQDHD